MTLFGRLVAMLRQRDDEAAKQSIEARRLAARIADQADELTEHLKKYHRARDPFAALMADMFNRDQISRIHRGPFQ